MFPPTWKAGDVHSLSTGKALLFSTVTDKKTQSSSTGNIKK
jgi:hypothetical protein